MPLSPRTQGMMAAQEAQSPKDIFEAAFQDLAMNQLITRNPEIAQDVATMKILESDPDTNTATGTFVINHNGEEIHIPVILADNELMPFDSMYVVSMDMMLPLTPEWLGEVQNTSMGEMGVPMKPPEAMTTDADIRNVVVPPTTGRYSYASAGRLLPAYLAQAPNQVKRAFVETMQRYPHIAKRAFEIYGVNTLHEAVTPRRAKVASSTAEITFITMDTPETQVRGLFGQRSPQAMRDVAEKGYAINDQRPDPTRLISTERPLEFEVPSSPGYYRVFLTDGRSRRALVFPHVITCHRLRYGKHGRNAPVYGDQEQYNETVRVGVTEDFELFSTEKDFVAQHLDVQETPESLNLRVQKAQPGTPRNGQRGLFFNPNHKNLIALEPIKIDMVRTSGDSRYVYGQLYSGERVLLIQIKGSPVSSPRMYSGERGYDGRHAHESVPYGFRTQDERRSQEPYGVDTTILVPYDWRFLEVRTVLEPNMVLKDPEAVTALFYDALTLSGAERIRLKNAHMGEFYVDNRYGDKLATLQYLVTRYNAHVGDAEELLKTAEERGAAECFTFTRPIQREFARRVKLAEGPMPADPNAAPPMDPNAAPPMDPNAAPPMDPSMMDPSMMDPSMMDPSMMAPPPPPPPSPVELAAQEVASELMSQHDQLMQQIAQQQQNVQTQLGAISAVVDRAHQIAQEMGAPPPMLPQMDPSMMGPPMDPSMMDPSMMDPAMGAGMPPEPPGMPVEDPTMMESAMQLEDPELFDAAAMASIASSNDFDASVSNFTPGLRDSLDAVGRMLTEVRMKTPELRSRLGDQTYTQIRDQLESLFSDLGETLSALNSVSTATPAQQQQPAAA